MKTVANRVVNHPLVNNRISKLCISLLLLLLLTACSHTLKLHVETIAGEPLKSDEKSYTLKSALSGVTEDDLYFQKISAYAHYILQQKGYQQANKAEDATLEILLSYGISDKNTSHHRYSTPTYDVIGGEIYEIESRTTDTAGKVTRSTEQVYVPMRVRQTGREYHHTKTTLYTTFLQLEAHSYLNNSIKNTSTRWRSTVELTSADKNLRRVIPHLAMALQQHLGQDNDAIVTIAVEKKSAEVKKFKRAVRSR
jgi:hypothetical protein